MDEKDKQILDMLTENSRISFTQIAKKLRLNEATIRKRVKRLEEDRVIKKYSVFLDPHKLGYNNVAVVGLDVEPALILEIAKKIADFPESRCVATSTGDHMIMAEIWANREDLTSILSNKIGKIEGVRKICPAIILEKIKEC